jgi:hypothetical protein
MKNSWALLLLLTACGSTDSSSWEKCYEAPCHTGPDSRWDIYADGGDVSDGDWDFLGPPDPYICLSVAGKTHCSASKSDSNSPRWSDLLLQDVSAESLTKAPLGVAYWDKDTGTLLDGNDKICSGTVTITAADLAEGGVRFECGKGSATFTFHFLR